MWRWFADPESTVVIRGHQRVLGNHYSCFTQAPIWRIDVKRLDMPILAIHHVNFHVAQPLLEDMKNFYCALILPLIMSHFIAMTCWKLRLGLRSQKIPYKMVQLPHSGQFQIVGSDPAGHKAEFIIEP